MISFNLQLFGGRGSSGGGKGGAGGAMGAQARPQVLSELPTKATEDNIESVIRTVIVNYGGGVTFGDGTGVGTTSGGGNRPMIYTSPDDMNGRTVSNKTFISFYNKHRKTGIEQ